jgi:hypothetical protein
MARINLSSFSEMKLKADLALLPTIISPRLGPTMSYSYTTTRISTPSAVRTYVALPFLERHRSLPLSSSPAALAQVAVKRIKKEIAGLEKESPDTLGGIILKPNDENITRYVPAMLHHHLPYRPLLPVGP